MKKRFGLFSLGIGILVLLVIAYFIPYTAEEGGNYLVKERILGIIIFHNPFILALYILAGTVLLFEGLRRK